MCMRDWVDFFQWNLKDSFKSFLFILAGTGSKVIYSSYLAKYDDCVIEQDTKSLIMGVLSSGSQFPVDMNTWESIKKVKIQKGLQTFNQFQTAKPVRD